MSPQPSLIRDTPPLTSELGLKRMAKVVEAAWLRLEEQRIEAAEHRIDAMKEFGP